MTTRTLDHHDAPAVRIPMTFLTTVAPQITAIEELQVCLAVFRLMAAQGGDEAPIGEPAILQDAPLRSALRQTGIQSDAREQILRGLELAVGRGTLIRFTVRRQHRGGTWFYLNTAVNRRTIEAMERGALPVPTTLWNDLTPGKVAVDPANVYRLYEQNIGPLTPLVADQLTTAASEYALDWIEDAIREAVSYNRRSWRYISKILENWQAHGRNERSS